MKKLLLTTAMVAATTAPLLASNVMTPGFFVGIYGGYTGLSTQTTVETTNNANPPLAQAFANYDMSGNGGHGGIQLGYDYVDPSGFVLGFDLFGHIGKTKGDLKAGTAANTGMLISLKQKHAYGAAARLGCMFGTTLAYLKVGYARSRFDAFVLTGTANPVPNASDANIQKLNLNGLVLGLGADMPINACMTVGFNYDFTMYKSKKYQTTYGAPINETINASFRPRTHAINLVVKYKF